MTTKKWMLGKRVQLLDTLDGFGRRIEKGTIGVVTQVSDDCETLEVKVPSPIPGAGDRYAWVYRRQVRFAPPCMTCAGEGRKVRADFDGDGAVVVVEPCEDCGGTGMRNHPAIEG